MGSSFLASVGEGAIARSSGILRVVSVVWGVLTIAFQPRYWPPTVRSVLGRQILFTGIDAMGLVFLIALMTGVSVVTQSQVWLGKIGQSELIAPLLVAVIVRELGPILVNLVVIARSGTAVATELAGMRVRGETGVMDALGLDPFVYLVLPRVAGMALSVLGLTVFFVAVSFSSGYIFGLLLGVTPADPGRFIGGVLGVITPRDVLGFLGKTLIPPAAVASICCLEGFGIRGSVNEVPQAATRAVVRSIAATLLISVLISILTYV